MVKDPFSGFSHLAGLALAIAGSAWLLARGSDDPKMTLGVVIYGASLVALYAASSAYHLVRAGARATRALRALDHAAIFLLVVGTCTPIFYRAFDGTARVAMLSIAWTGAALGSLLRLAWPSAPRAVYTTLYLALGWLVVVRLSDVVRALPLTAFALVVAGGVTYTAGAIVYVRKRPNPLPRVFGFHEIWHLFVLGGSALHFGAIALIE